jgi:hypothetical protein
MQIIRLPDTCTGNALTLRNFGRSAELIMTLSNLSFELGTLNV